MRALVAALLLVSLGCSKSPTEPGAGTATAQLRYGETVNILGMRLSFEDITDSRCPKEVACVWEGDAAVQLQSNNERLLLHTTGVAGQASGKLGGADVTLVEVQPQRITLAEMKKTDYVITIRVSR